MSETVEYPFDHCGNCGEVVNLETDPLAEIADDPWCADCAEGRCLDLYRKGRMSGEDARTFLVWMAGERIDAQLAGLAQVQLGEAV